MFGQGKSDDGYYIASAMPLTLFMPLSATLNQTLKQNEALIFFSPPENSLLEYQYLMFCAHTRHAIDIRVSFLQTFFFYMNVLLIVQYYDLVGNAT